MWQLKLIYIHTVHSISIESGLFLSITAYTLQNMDIIIWDSTDDRRKLREERGVSKRNSCMADNTTAIFYLFHLKCCYAPTAEHELLTCQVTAGT